MNGIFLLFLFSLLPLCPQSKVMEGTFTPLQFQSHSHFYYLGKMDYGIGVGTLNVSLSHSQTLEEIHLPTLLYIGILIDDQYQLFHSTSNCKQRESLIHQKQQILLSEEVQRVNFQIEQSVREHLWYIFVFNCELDRRALGATVETGGQDSRIEYKLIMMNNGSHFGEDEQVYHFYWVLTTLSFVLFLALRVSDRRDSDPINNQQTNYPLYFLKLGNFVLVLGLILKVVHLYFYSLDGNGFFVLEFMSSMLKALSEATVLTILVVISWGWTINYYQCQYYQLIIPCGVSAAFIHMLLYPLSLFIEGDLNQDHHYDYLVGNLILYYRTIVFVSIIVGLFSTYSESRPHSRPFILKFGVLAAVYAGCDILGVVICELALPKYLQQEVMIGVSDTAHLAINAALVYIFSRGGLGYQEIKMEPQKDRGEDKLQ